MKPAFSVILLTTLIGAGQGLFIALYSADWLSTLSILPPVSPALGGQAALLGVALLAAGLVASFFHLGHPERAWRAASQWRSSWLSREVIALPAAMALMLAFAVVTLGGLDRELWMLGGGVSVTLATLLGFVALLAVLALFVCTGFTLATALAALAGDPRFDYFAAVAIWLTIAGLLSRWASLARNRSLGPASKLQSAIGVHHPKIRQLAQGAMFQYPGLHSPLRCGGGAAGAPRLRDLRFRVAARTAAVGRRSAAAGLYRRLRAAIPGTARRTLVFFHRGRAPAERLLPGDFLTARHAGGDGCCWQGALPGRRLKSRRRSLVARRAARCRSTKTARGPRGETHSPAPCRGSRRRYIRSPSPRYGLLRTIHRRSSRRPRQRTRWRSPASVP